MVMSWFFLWLGCDIVLVCIVEMFSSAPKTEPKLCKMGWTHQLELGNQAAFAEQSLTVDGTALLHFLVVLMWMGSRYVKKNELLGSLGRNGVCENHVWKLEVFKWEEKGCEWVRYCQPNMLSQSRWFHSSILSPGTFPPAALHHASPAGILRNTEVLVERDSLGVILGDVLFRDCRTLFWLGDLSCSCPYSTCQQDCREERLWRLHACEWELLDADTAVQWGSPNSPTLSARCGGCSKKPEQQDCLFSTIYPNLQSNGDQRNFNTAILHGWQHCSEMVLLNFHLGASCLTERVGNITPLWPKNEALGELVHPTVKNEQWKQWSCQVSYQDANKYPGCQAGGAAGPLVQHKGILQGRGMTADPSPQQSYPFVEVSSECAMIHIFKAHYLVSGVVNARTYAPLSCEKHVDRRQFATGTGFVVRCLLGCSLTGDSSHCSVPGGQVWAGLCSHLQLSQRSNLWSCNGDMCLHPGLGRSHLPTRYGQGEKSINFYLWHQGTHFLCSTVLSHAFDWFTSLWCLLPDSV